MPWSQPLLAPTLSCVSVHVLLCGLLDLCVICVYLIDELQQQLAAYVSWVNSQLKRKPGLTPITNLRHDLQDGVVLTQLIDIVGKYANAHLHTQMWCSNAGGRIRKNMLVSGDETVSK